MNGALQSKGNLARGSWFEFALVGLVVGALSAYFGPLTLPAVFGLLSIAALSTPRLSTVSGSLLGLGIGAAGVLWLGSQCPPSTTCTAEFPIGAYVATAVVAISAGIVLTVLAITKRAS
jgi:hypothetical protein